MPNTSKVHTQKDTNNTTPLISIIIPTYNVQNYIARCLQSCINQTLKDIEILVIDDCGSDDSIKIAQDFAKADSRIKILHNPQNLGTFATRIQGIGYAKGAYILFVDADDYLQKQACEIIQNAITANQTDIIHFKAHYPLNPKASLIANLTHLTRYILPTRFCSKKIQGTQIAYHFFLASRHFPKFTLWDKCYKSSLIRQSAQYFLELRLTPIIADDLLFFFVIAQLSTSYVGIKERLYFYLLNPTSSMNNPQKVQRRIESLLFVSHMLHHLAHNDLANVDSFPYAKNISAQINHQLAALIILESRLLGKQGGGRFYSCSSYAPCRGKSYYITQNPAPYALYPLALFTLLHTFFTILESLFNLYPPHCIYPKFKPHQTLISLFILQQISSCVQDLSIRDLFIDVRRANVA